MTGSITDLQSYVALNCRLIDAQTGGIFAAAQVKIVKDDDLRKLMAAMVAPLEGEGRGSTTAEKKVPVQKQQAGNLSVELKECRISGISVKCDFLAVNSAEEKHFWFYAWQSRLLDEEGNEYKGTSGAFGGRGQEDFVQAILATGVPIKVQLTFQGIPAELQRATLLDIPFNNAGVQFRNVLLVRE